MSDSNLHRKIFAGRKIDAKSRNDLQIFTFRSHSRFGKYNELISNVSRRRLSREFHREFVHSLFKLEMFFNVREQWADGLKRAGRTPQTGRSILRSNYVAFAAVD